MPAVVGDDMTKAMKTKPTSTPKSSPTASSESAVETLPRHVHDVREHDEGRDVWSNQLEFILSVLGLSVGLGNIWRFPIRAYDNGGSAFLIPYLTCALLFGLPAIYLEFLLGQYHRTTPPNVFRRIAPVLQGVGWMSVAVASLVSVYYIVLIGWIGIYMWAVLSGGIGRVVRCNNPWNDARFCLDMSDQDSCMSNVTHPLQFNGTCHPREIAKKLHLVVASEQYFTDHVLQPSTGLLDINHVNWPAFVAVAICWVCTAIVLCKGVEYMGKTSYITVIMPYVILMVLFVRGVTLDGASDGLWFYLGRPDFSIVFGKKAWAEALTHMCFSLAIGYGGLIAMASYSKPRNNCFRDALIVVVGDTVTSLIGGGAVFSTLGFLAKQTGQTVPEVTKSGHGLAFIAYPEAMSKMPWTWLWAFLFFLMLFFLGISAEIAMVEIGCAALYDQIPALRNRKGLVSSLFCGFLFLIGIVMCTDAGKYWFEMFDEYAAGVSACISGTAEILIVAYVYGSRNQATDMMEMLGPPRNALTKWVGMQSPYFVFNWSYLSPVFGIALTVLSAFRSYPYLDDPVKYPPMFDIIGWTLCAIPVLMVPIFGVVAYVQLKSGGWDTRALWMKQRQLRSYPRIYAEMDDAQKLKQFILPDREPWDKSAKGFRFPSAQSKERELESGNEFETSPEEYRTRSDASNKSTRD